MVLDTDTITSIDQFALVYALLCPGWNVEAVYGPVYQ